MSAYVTVLGAIKVTDVQELKGFGTAAVMFRADGDSLMLIFDSPREAYTQLNQAAALAADLMNEQESHNG